MSELRGQLQESYSNSTHSCPTHALMFTLAIDPITAFGSRGISPRKGSDRLVSYSHSTAHPKGSPLGVHDPKDATSRGTTKSRSASGGRRAGPRLLRSLNSGLHRREQTLPVPVTRLNYRPFYLSYRRVPRKGMGRFFRYWRAGSGSLFGTHVDVFLSRCDGGGWNRGIWRSGGLALGQEASDRDRTNEV